MPTYVHMNVSSSVLSRVRRLVEFAERKAALLLVVGARRSPGGDPPSIVAGGLFRAAPCPVVVVPETAARPTIAD